MKRFEMGLLSCLLVEAQGFAQAIEVDPFAKLRGIQPEVMEPYWTIWRCSVVGGGILVGLIAVGMGVTIWMKNRRPVIVEIDPTVEAMEGVRRLRQAGMEMSSRDFAEEISTVLRRYIERAKGIAATKQTADEFLGSSELREGMSEEERGVLKNFLVLIDQVKFGGESIEEGLRHDLIAMVENWVRGGRD